jgi:hypothetical protein
VTLSIFRKDDQNGIFLTGHYLQDVNDVYKHDCKILKRRNIEEVMKSYLIPDDQLMELYCDPINVITPADVELQEKFNAISIVALKRKLPYLVYIDIFC